jgi:hypothetical protein
VDDMKDCKETKFKNYCLAYYGEDGIYEDFFGDLTENELEAAIKARKDYKGLEFCGDSYDREIVRDLIFFFRGCSLSSLEHQNIVGKILNVQSLR